MGIAIYWLIGGAVLLAFEAFGIPGIGSLFAGLAAILVGLLIESGLIAVDAVIAQWAIFFLATGLFALLLWKKLKKWRMNPSVTPYSNIVGTEAQVTQPIEAGGEGQVRWSGTLMRARGVEGQAIAIGVTVRVQAVEGNVLHVIPRG